MTSMPASDERVDASATSDPSTAAPEPSADKKHSGIRPSVLTAAALVTLVLVMARVTVHAGTPLDNGDTWFHLRIGHQLLGSWSLGHPGRLSRFATSPWVPTQWSTELLAAKMEDWFGLPGVAWMFGALFLTFVVGLYLLCRRECAPIAAAVATSLAVIGAAPALSARPQVVTLVLLVVVMAAWMRAARDLTVPWLLVPLTWVWATAHGMWSIGVVVSVVAVLGLLLDRRLDRKAFLSMAAVPVMSVVAACLTPIGPRLLLSQVAVGARSSLISEWQPTSFRELPAFLIAVMIALVVMRWARSGRVSWFELLLLLTAAGMAAMVGRMVGCAGVILAPILASALQGLLESTNPRKGVSRGEGATVIGAAVACLIALAVAVPHTARQPGGVPDRVASRLEALPAGSAVAVQDYTGGWVEYRFPKLNPTIDGLLDAYPVSYIQAFSDFRTLQPGWRRFLERSGARVAILEKGSALTAAMERDLHWRIVDSDQQWVYLVAPGS